MSQSVSGGFKVDGMAQVHRIELAFVGDFERDGVVLFFGMISVPVCMSRSGNRGMA